MLATWLSQRTQARVHWLEQDVSRRQDLYKEFIEEAPRRDRRRLRRSPGVPTHGQAQING